MKSGTMGRFNTHDNPSQHMAKIIIIPSQRRNVINGRGVRLRYCLTVMPFRIAANIIIKPMHDKAVAIMFVEKKNPFVSSEDVNELILKFGLLFA